MAKVDTRSKAPKVTHSGRTTSITKRPDTLSRFTVDGTEYEIDLAAISAIDDDDLAAESRSHVDLVELVGSSTNRTQSIRHVAALVWLACRQKGRPRPWRDVCAEITMTTVVEFDLEEDDDPEA